MNLFTLSKSEQYSFVDEVFKDVLLAHVIKQSFYEQLLPLANFTKLYQCALQKRSQYHSHRETVHP